MYISNLMKAHKSFGKTTSIGTFEKKLLRDDVFANVVVVTPPESADIIYKSTEPFINSDKHLAAGITHLPNGAGLLYKVLGTEPGPVKALVREFASKVRQAVKCKPLPKEFPWR